MIARDRLAGASLLVLGAALVSWATIVATLDEAPAQLATDVLSGSRGNNQGSQITHVSCEVFNYIGCWSEWQIECETCPMSYFLSTGGGGQGYDFGQEGNWCGGHIEDGLCDENLNCTQGVPTAGDCYGLSPPDLQ